MTLEKDKHISNKVIGQAGEQYICDRYINEGYSLLCKNYAVHNVGEIDLILKKDFDIYFVEVKSRRTTTFGMPAESVTNDKIHKIKNVAQYFLQKFNFSDYCVHFDVAEVFINKDCIFSYNIIKDAF